MIAQLWANKIIQGVKAFDEVPAKLREQVSCLLSERGAGNLIEE